MPFDQVFQRNWHYLNRPYDLHFFDTYLINIYMFTFGVFHENDIKNTMFKIKKRNGYQFFLLSMELMCRTALLLRKWFNLWKVVLCIKLVMSEKLSFSTIVMVQNSIPHMILCTVFFFFFCLPILLVSISFEEQMYNLNNITSQPTWALLLLFFWHSFMPNVCTVIDLTSGFVNIIRFFFLNVMLKINVAFSNYWGEKMQKLL